MVQSVSVAVPLALVTPPPPYPAEFPLIMQSVSVATPNMLFHSPPPEFPLIVQPVNVTVPLLKIPPMLWSEEFSLIVQSVSVSVPVCTPRRLAARSFADRAVSKRQGSLVIERRRASLSHPRWSGQTTTRLLPSSTSSTVTFPPPLTDRGPFRARHDLWPRRFVEVKMCWRAQPSATWQKRPGRELMTLPAGLVLALAWLMAQSRLADGFFRRRVGFRAGARVAQQVDRVIRGNVLSAIRDSSDLQENS